MPSLTRLNISQIPPNSHRSVKEITFEESCEVHPEEILREESEDSLTEEEKSLEEENAKNFNLRVISQLDTQRNSNESEENPIANGN